MFIFYLKERRSWQIETIVICIECIMMIAVGSERSVRTIKEKYDTIKDVQSGMPKKAVSEKYIVAVFTEKYYNGI